MRDMLARMDDGVIDLATTPIHLGLGAKATPQETFTGDTSWYERYGERTAADGVDGRLVTIHSFSEPWSMWEMHPHGHEVVACIGGSMVVHRELPDGTRRTVSLHVGQAVIDEPGTWHTADTDDATALFITAGVGTQHRPR